MKKIECHCGECNSCKKKSYQKLYKEINKERLKLKNAQYYLSNKEKIDKRNLNYYHDENNKEKIKQKNLEYLENNKDLIKKNKSIYYENNKEHIKEKSKDYYENNREKHKNSTKKWVIENKEKHNKYRREKSKKDRKTRPYFYAWRDVLKGTIKRLSGKKNGLTIDLLGYSALDLKNHIEKQFHDGMSWENYGKWQIDHIKEVCTFDKNTPQNVVNALTNLQPLWEKDNLQKWFVLKRKLKNGKS